MQDWINQIFAEQFREVFGEKGAGPIEQKPFILLRR